VGLLKILDDMNAPDYAFEAIIKWSRDAHEAKYSFYPQGGLTRARNVNVLFLSMDNATKLLPAVRNMIVVPHGLPCHVIVYDFVPQLLSLLQNPDIMIQANLLIDVMANWEMCFLDLCTSKRMPCLLITQSANCLCQLFNGLIAHTLQAMLVSR
jgi:hypothetical protein